jgi:predicted nucleic-acid-binding protein
MQIVDANIVLRYLLEDSEELAAKAAQIIDNNEITLPIEVLSEVVYVLAKVYGMDRKSISAILLDFFNSIDVQTAHREAVIAGLKYYGAKKLDFVDCILAGYAKCEHAEIHSFDENLRKLIEKEKSRG